MKKRSLQLYLHTVDIALQQGGKERNNRWFHRLNTTIKHNLSNSCYTIPQLADDMGISHRQLCRRLKQLTGLSPLDYMKEVRLQQARLLLEQKRFKTVTQTAKAVGFKHPDTFTRNFCQYFGEKPWLNLWEKKYHKKFPDIAAPGLVQAYQELAGTYLEAGAFKTAKEHALAGTKLDTTHNNLHLLLALSCAHTEDGVTQAEELIEQFGEGPFQGASWEAVMLARLLKLENKGLISPFADRFD